MGTTLLVIQQGAAAVDEEELVFLGIGSAGDPDACRILRFPANVSPLLAPITYTVGSLGLCCNPSRTLNLDNVVLPHPLTEAVRTLGTTRVIRFEEQDEDVIVTEIWEGSENEAAMTTAFFRSFYEYLINADLIPASGTLGFIQWEPRDRSDRVYNVELLSLEVGGGGDQMRFDVVDLRDQGGDNIANALDSLTPPGTPTGVVDREVRLRMRIISEEP